jgi:hypothetical protein
VWFQGFKAALDHADVGASQSDNETPCTSALRDVPTRDSEA